MCGAHLYEAMAAICKVHLGSMNSQHCAGCAACAVRSPQAVACDRGRQRGAALYRPRHQRSARPDHQLAVQLWALEWVCAALPGGHQPLMQPLHACRAEQDRMGRAVLDAAWARAAKVERSPVFRQKNPELDIRNPEPYDRCAAPRGTGLQGCQSSGSAAAQMCATFPLHDVAAVCSWPSHDCLLPVHLRKGDCRAELLVCC